MQQLIYFFQKFKYLLFFLMLQLIAVALTFNNLNFHKSKYVSSANAITGGMYNQASSILEYIHLKSVNQQLLEENTLLRNQLEKNNSVVFNIDSTVVDSIKYNQKYTFTNAKIINNNYSKAFNYLTINKGKNEGLDKEMAVVNGRGIVGITDFSSSKYTRVQSILNKNSNINAKLRNQYFFGSLKWDGKDYNVVQLTDVPRQAPVKVGDTIETGGRSTIFPAGILIGTVINVDKNNSVDNIIDVKLFNDMSNIGPVYVIKNLDKEEIKFLESQDIE
ncbi:rod shape-determining protein MreC [Polaribacter batillariae]|uniref:Cell shape-determining protein MreC n=1 Tax=Polaribacter batillariae TaxID=2808900 RepID=A0ABX7STE4_9FLAO|nr:rod shape-determining protein MreC [Polaribacter batillariae]QTD36816.1 rod shape-determining protein MreC [Polaribacter batillariae]